ncbi:MAG: hypothetical protein COZ72_07425 [Elusimicrobia bacterium CG_4_8_14_3_um_filter_50_9]|nr:MAG: hypothetical protein COZ72_07425 [Elusimicrobia bacterium CG_4_8_14_3_um_filter_50_9]
MKDNYKKRVAAANKKNRKKFLKIPFAERMILIPQCLRNSKKCRAKESGPFFICADCGACKIKKIREKASRLGYKKIYILKGGKIIPSLFEKDKPLAVIGVACEWEGFLGQKICGEFKIPVQFFPLSRDGCADTDVGTDAFLKFIEE